MEPQNLVKKRGRKPKQKYIVNDNPIFDNNNNEQIIINIKKKKKREETKKKKYSK